VIQEGFPAKGADAVAEMAVEKEKKGEGVPMIQTQEGIHPLEKEIIIPEHEQKQRRRQGRLGLVPQNQPAGAVDQSGQEGGEQKRPGQLMQAQNVGVMCIEKNHGINRK